ncbi:MAG: SH3 domain-containing protein [Chloroflexi bacterium]|nr:SH3 domain-containing protein [Chloroflexota bacterium]
MLLFGGTVGLLEAAPSATVRADGQCLRLRAAPSTTATLITCLPDGTPVTPLEGQAEADGHLWRQVRSPDGLTGWVAATFLIHSPIPGNGPAALSVPPPAGITTGLAGTVTPAAIVAAQPFPVSAIFVFNIERQRYLTFVPGAPAMVNTLTPDTLSPEDVVLVRRAGATAVADPSGGVDGSALLGDSLASGIAQPFRVPPRGGMTHGIARTGDLDALIAAQPFAVASVMVWDVEGQRWRWFTHGVPEMVNSLRAEDLHPDAAVFIRRSLTEPDPLPPVVEPVATSAGLATVTYYYCERGVNPRSIGDGGGFCGRMASGLVVYEGAAACARSLRGQRFRIAGDPLARTYVCEDTGGGVGGNHRDIWFAVSDAGYDWWRQVGPRAEIFIVD